MPGQSQQFYHSCGTQGTYSRDIHVVHVARELDTVARRIQRFQARASIRIRRNPLPLFGGECLADCTRQGGCTFQASRNLDTIALTLRRSPSIEAIGRELVSPVLNVCACGIGKALAF